MKPRIFLIQLLLLFILLSCKNDIIEVTDDVIEVADNGITFCKYDVETNTTSTLIKYEEILGYDSIKYAFVLEEQAWQKLEKKIIQSNIFKPPFPDFVIEITLNNNLIYRVGYLPNFSATIHFDRMLFKLQEPNIIFIQPEVSIEMYKGDDLRNSPKLIEQLKKDNKLIELEDFPYAG